MFLGVAGHEFLLDGMPRACRHYSQGHSGIDYVVTFRTQVSELIVLPFRTRFLRDTEAPLRTAFDSIEPVHFL